MNVRKLVALLLALVMAAALLTACGASSKGYDAAAPEADYDEAPMEDVIVEEAWDEEGLSSVADNVPALPENQKIITTLNLSAQTEEMDPLLEKINAKITQLGGYMESQEIYNGSSYNSYRHRYAYLTIRIPADQLQSFVALVQEQANLVSHHRKCDAHLCGHRKPDHRPGNGADPPVRAAGKGREYGRPAAHRVPADGSPGGAGGVYLPAAGNGQ